MHTHRETFNEHSYAAAPVPPSQTTDHCTGTSGKLLTSPRYGEIGPEKAEDFLMM